MLASDITSSINQGRRFANVVEENASEIVRILTSYESRMTAADELWRTLSCLRGLENELPYLAARVNRIASFLPINQPLYGLTLFGLVPSLMALEDVAVRPAVVARHVIRELYELLKIETHMPRVRIMEVERHEFLVKCVRRADVTLFVGRYENAIQVLKSCQENSLFVFNGAGVNPFLILENANLELATRKVIYAKLYNSGQDCAAPDTILVHKTVAESFIDRLCTTLSRVKVGVYNDDETVVGPLVDQRSFARSVDFMQKNKKCVVHGGMIDIPKNIIHPTVVQVQLSDRKIYDELYAPIIVVSEFSESRELDAYFSSNHYLDHAMYLSKFGSTSDGVTVGKTIFLEEGSVLDHEQGNKAFGGFGRCANFSISRGGVKVRPILISREIWDHSLQGV